MGPELVLAIDEGTTNAKVLVVSRDGAVVARAWRPVETRFPAPGWLEQDALALWEAVREAIRRYGPPEVFNTEQGCQFTSQEFTGFLKDQRLIQDHLSVLHHN